MPKTLKLPVAKMDEIAPGRAKVFRYGIQNGIAYNDGGVIRGYVNFCTHAGGPLELKSGCVFQCMRHHAEFDAKTGERLSGQAPEGSKLKPIELIQEGDQILALLELKDEFDF